MTNKKNNTSCRFGLAAALLVWGMVGLLRPVYAAPPPAAAADAANGVSKTEAPPPSITIGGRDVMTVVRELKAKSQLPVPASLSDGVSQHYLNNRVYFVPYNHSPQRWNADAQITIIELSDLGCLECMPQLHEMDELLEDVHDKVNYLQIYAPTPTSSAVQLAQFYGKIAQKNSAFWEYRKKLQSLTEADVNTYFNLLVNMGLDHTAVRRAAIRDSRRFYRELDADARLVHKKKLAQSPMWLVNGVKVGKENAIPVAKIKDLLQYEQDRLIYEAKQRAKMKRKAP